MTGTREEESPFARPGASPGTRFLAGIDEAGFGPLLGPLTIGFSVFRAPPAIEADGLWRALRPAVSRDPERDGKRLVVDDSKLVFARNPRGARRLEATALAFLAAVDGVGNVLPTSGRELLEFPARELRVDALALARHPWYARLARELPAHVETKVLDRRRRSLGRALARSEVSVAAAGARVVPSGELNRSFAATGNKSLTLWRESARVLEWLFERFGGEPGGLDVVCDRHGGRLHYAKLLEETFPFAHVRVGDERRDGCRYAVSEPVTGREMSLVFMERAEGASLATALASCLAKYAREVCMDAFNAYFGDLQPELVPTAGYYNDARRWLAEAVTALERAALPAGLLVRER